MVQPLSPATENLGLHRLMMACPRLWPCWPYLPLVRRRPGRERELGLLFDAWGTVGLTGYAATVFLCNAFTLPHSFAAFLELPREVFDNADEVVAAGWRID